MDKYGRGKRKGGKNCMPHSTENTIDMKENCYIGTHEKKRWSTNLFISR
jgi:hypothetical protein